MADYEFRGTPDEVTEFVEGQHRAYPTPGYGTWFNWDPITQKGRKHPQDPTKDHPYLAPTFHEDGTVTVRGHRSNSCD